MGQFFIEVQPQKKSPIHKSPACRDYQRFDHFLTASNPLAKALFIWLKERANLNRWIEGDKIRTELLEIAANENLNFKDYKNDQKLGTELFHIL